MKQYCYSLVQCDDGLWAAFHNCQFWIFSGVFFTDIIIFGEKFSPSNCFGIWSIGFYNCRISFSLPRRYFLSRLYHIFSFQLLDEFDKGFLPPCLLPAQIFLVLTGTEKFTLNYTLNLPFDMLCPETNIQHMFAFITRYVHVHLLAHTLGFSARARAQLHAIQPLERKTEIVLVPTLFIHSCRDTRKLNLKAAALSRGFCEYVEHLI